MLSSKVQKGAALLMVILIRRASGASEQQINQLAHHFEGDQLLCLGIMHPLVGTCLLTCIASAPGVLVLLSKLSISMQSVVCRTARSAPQRICTTEQAQQSYAFARSRNLDAYADRVCNTTRPQDIQHAGGDDSSHARGVHALNEIIYQESRKQAEAARELISDRALSGTVTDMGSNVRIWVIYSPLRSKDLSHSHFCRTATAGMCLCDCGSYTFLRAVTFAGPLLSYIQLSAVEGAIGPYWWDILSLLPLQSSPHLHVMTIW